MIRQEGPLTGRGHEDLQGKGGKSELREGQTPTPAEAGAGRGCCQNGGREQGFRQPLSPPVSNPAGSTPALPPERGICEGRHPWTTQRSLEGEDCGETSCHTGPNLPPERRFELSRN